MKNQFSVVIGRFQPFHNAHLQLVREAAAKSDNVIILVGSSNRSRTFKNPFDFEQRWFMIANVLNKEDLDAKIHIRPIEDFPYNDAAWVAGIHQEVANVVSSVGLENVSPDITLFGHDKDESTYYLNLFPKWKLKLIPALNGGISATDIRESLFENGNLHGVPSLVKTYVSGFMSNPEGQRVRDEYHFIKKYKEGFSSLPYEPIFTTTDAVVYFKGYILMVKRKGFPGKGQWALPGGFLESDMRIKDSMIKEVKEETSIRVATPILFGNLRKIEVFDDPHRSLRGRTVTHCGLIVLDSVTSLQTLPKVKGGSDASHSTWVSINELEDMKNNIFEDHYFIIKQMLHMS